MANSEMFQTDNVRPTHRKENKEIILKKISEDIKIHQDEIKRIKKKAHEDVLLLRPDGKDIIKVEKEFNKKINEIKKELKELKENYNNNYLKETLPIYLFNKEKNELKENYENTISSLKEETDRKIRNLTLKTINRPEVEFKKELHKLEKNHNIIRKEIKKNPDLGKIAIAEELAYIDEKHQVVVDDLTLKYKDSIEKAALELLKKEEIKPEINVLKDTLKEKLIEEKALYNDKLTSLVSPLKEEIKESTKQLKASYKESKNELYLDLKNIENEKREAVKAFGEIKDVVSDEEKLKEIKQEVKAIKKKEKEELTKQKQEIKKINGFRPRKLTYNRRKVLFGLIFAAPWIIGFLILFVYPFIQSLYYSFFELTPSPGHIGLKFVGIDNYIYAFQEHVFGSDSSFKIEILNTLQDSIINLFVLVVFSLFIAVLLNHEFKGRAFVRAIFFIPVILNSGAVSIALSKGGDLTDLLLKESAVNVFNLGDYLMNMGLGTSLIGFIVGLIGRIYDIITLSGVPILLFLAAIQSVPKHLYEAATIEGATGYEQFWLITLPNVSPHIITVSIYAIVDTFLTSSVSTIITHEYNQQNWGLSSAMSWIYVGLIIGILLVLTVLAKIFKIGESHYEREK